MYLFLHPGYENMNIRGTRVSISGVRGCQYPGYDEYPGYEGVNIHKDVFIFIFIV